MSVDKQDTWSPGDDIPSGESRTFIAVWRSYDVNECRECGLEFDGDASPSSGPLRDHLEECHPRACECGNMASYWRSGGWTRKQYCASCLYELEDVRPLSDWSRVDNPANEPAPRLPDTHPVEEAIQGLHGGESP